MELFGETLSVATGLFLLLALLMAFGFEFVNVGFVCSAVLLLVLKAIVRSPKLYEAPDPTKAPPFWIRSILVLTCTGVSFAHGSNDGQKGMGF